MKYLVDFYYFAFEAAGELGGRERLDVACAKIGDALGGFDFERDLGVLGANDVSIYDHVFFEDVDMVVHALVDGIEVHVSVQFFEAELLNVLLAHVDKVKHLELVAVEFDTEGDGNFDFGMLGEASYGIGM